MPRTSKSSSKSSAAAAQAPSGADRFAGMVRPAATAIAITVWVFLAAAMLTLDTADAPWSVKLPTNDPVQNICGPAGAIIAGALFRGFGLAAWGLLLGSAGVIALIATGRHASQAVVRVLGLVVAGAGLAGLVAQAFPGSGPYPDLPGGSVGVVGAHELVSRFGPFGGGLWLILISVIGLVMAYDRWLVVVPLAIWRQTGPVARTTSTVARAISGPVMIVARPVVSLAKKLVAARPLGRANDLDGEDLPDEHKPAKSKKPKKAKIAETAGGLGGGKTLEIDTGDDEGEEEEDWEEIAEDEEEEDEDTPGAPQVFTESDVRDKVAKLPLRFSGANKSMATAEDLADLQNESELEGYQFPGLDLLEEPDESFGDELEELVREQAERLETALRHYQIMGEVVGIESGPAITLYDVALAPGTKVSKLTAVSSDVARALKAVNIRIVTNQRGKDTVGVEVPNPKKERVRLKELMSERERFSKMKLPMFLGKDSAGDPLIEDLTKMPHMLIAGTTGSGKSVCMNTIIMSWLYTKKPNELKMVLVDPKMVEMSQFKDIPHLMCPVVTEMSKAAAILEWACTKMDERYELLADAGCRDISGYNELDFEEICERMEATTDEQKQRIPRRLPYMVFIIDELADLMMTAKEVEGSIIRIAQKARAVGIHLILATQRPQANVVTGLIKSNMPCRVSFKVRSGMDSRIVLDHKGGEVLLGQGDMLFLSANNQLIRAQGTLVDDSEIRKVAKFIKNIAKPSFERQLTTATLGMSDDEARILESENHSSASLAAAQEDPMFDRAVEIVLETKRGSVSLLQRRLAIGYTRASRLIDLMGIAGIISDHKGSVARDVLITPELWEQMKAYNEQELERMRDNGGVPGEEIEEPTADAVEAYENAQGSTLRAGIVPTEAVDGVEDAEAETAIEHPVALDDELEEDSTEDEPNSEDASAEEASETDVAEIEEDVEDDETDLDSDDVEAEESEDAESEEDVEEEADEEESSEEEEYEYVYVDEDGNEIPADEVEEDEEEEDDDEETEDDEEEVDEDESADVRRG